VHRSADALVPSGDDGRPRHVQQQLQPSGLDRLEEHREAADRPVYDMVRRARGRLLDRFGTGFHKSPRRTGSCERPQSGVLPKIHPRPVVRATITL